MIVNARQFSRDTGWPVKMVRDYCKGGVIPCKKLGTRYLFDEDEALAILHKQMRFKEVPEIQVQRKPETASFDFKAELKKAAGGTKC
jgi:hypothetical protein